MEEEEKPTQPEEIIITESIPSVPPVQDSSLISGLFFSLKTSRYKLFLLILLGVLLGGGIIFGAYKLFSAKEASFKPAETPTPTMPLLSTPAPTEVPALTPTPTLTTTLTTAPTKKPIPPRPTSTRVPAPTSTPTLQPTPTSVPPAPPANQLRCEIIANPQGGPAPLTVSLTYSVLNIGGNAYVTGIQWDYNGDGNWDTNLSLNNSQVSHTYTDVGVHTIKMQAQLSDGRMTDICSYSVAAQPH